MGYIDLQIEDSVAIVWLDQPDEKVNKLSMDLLDEFQQTLDSIENNSNIQGAVLISRKQDNFIAGADLDMLKSVKKADEGEEMSRKGSAMLNRIANSKKPFIAAINGAALGGGFEVALACHYRIATDHPKTVFGLPEVKLGLLPGAGGTQRLWQLIGIQEALPLLLTGKNVYPRKAKKIGLIDHIIHPYGLLKAGKDAVAMVQKNPPKRKVKMHWTKKLLESNPLTRKIIYSQAHKGVMKQTQGNYPAPLRILECVQKGVEKGFAAGSSWESKKFGELVVSPESRQLVNLFFNMNDAKKNPLADKVKSFDKIGILGGGFMGAGIAEVTIDQEIPVVMKDVSREAASKGERMVFDQLNKQVKKKIISSFERDVKMSHLFATDDYQSLRKVDVVIEAVFEDLDLKQKVLGEVEENIPGDFIFASNTSSLPISEIGGKAKHPEHMIGMHYFSPVAKMPLLEIITTDQTADWVEATAYEIALKQGKTPIVVYDGPGFYTTRVLAPLMNEATALVHEGAEIEQIDRAMKKFGFPVGPMALFDEVGIDVAAHVSEVMGEFFAKRTGEKTDDTIEKIYNAGYHGRKNKKGFYLYDKKKKRVNEEIYSFFKRQGDKLSREEIQKRISLIFINEAVYCLEDKILKAPKDGDLGAILGVGFPPFLGGPFRYIDTLGASKVVAQLEELAEKYPRFAPPKLLKEHAEQNKKFYQE